MEGLLKIDSTLIGTLAMKVSRTIEGPEYGQDAFWF